MGAFLLVRIDASCNASGMLDVFRQKGFALLRRFKLPLRPLRLFSKVLVSGSALAAESAIGLCAVGTPPYEDLGSAESLRRMLDYWKGGCFDYRELRGSFAVLIQSGGSLHSSTDGLGIQKVFHNDACSVISDVHDRAHCPGWALQAEMTPRQPRGEAACHDCGAVCPDRTVTADE